MALAAALTCAVAEAAKPPKPPGESKVFTVTTAEDSGTGSLRQAVLDANANPNGPDPALPDTIQFAVSGEIRLTSGRLSITDHVTIVGPGADVVTVSSVYTPTKRSRPFPVFQVASGVRVDIAGLTIAGGTSPEIPGGGGIVNSGTLNVSNCTIAGNLNAGINTSGAVTVTSCIITHVSGNGIANWDPGTLVVADCTVTENGYIGIWNGGVLTVSRSTLSRNFGLGGAIGNATEGRATVRDCTISDNEGDGFGGAIFNLGTLTVLNSTLSGNAALPSDAFLPPTAGGGMYNVGALKVFNSTITDNAASVGAGIYCTDTAVLEMRNTILAGNEPDDLWGDLAAGSDFNLIGGDPRLGPLQDNGGPTWTHALLPDSPAIDLGDPDFDPLDFDPPLLTDQRGENRVAGGRIDIGAFELQPSQ